MATCEKDVLAMILEVIYDPCVYFPVLKSVDHFSTFAGLVLVDTYTHMHSFK